MTDPAPTPPRPTHLELDQITWLTGGCLLLIDPRSQLIVYACCSPELSLALDVEGMIGGHWSDLAQWVHPDDRMLMQLTVEHALATTALRRVQLRFWLAEARRAGVEADYVTLQMNVGGLPTSGAQRPVLICHPTQVGMTAPEETPVQEAGQSESPARRAGQQHGREVETILYQMLQLQDCQQQAVAYEIHDGVLQEVIAAKMEAEAILATVRHGGCVQPEALQDLVELLEKAISEARQLVGLLRPIVLDRRGIAESIRDWAQHLFLEKGFAVDFHCQLLHERFSPQLENCLLRIIHEAIQNAVRYSGADRVEVRLWQEAGSLQLRIEDQGAGFDPQSVPRGHYGLESIQQRAVLLGGRAQITSQPGQGTVVWVDLPG